LIQSIGYGADFVCNGLELTEKFNIEQHKIVITDMVSVSC